MKQILIKKTTLVAFFVLINFYSFSQVNDLQFAFLKTELVKKGITETEADIALKESGIDVSKLSSEELIAQKDQISAVLDGVVEKKKRIVQPLADTIQKNNLDSLPVQSAAKKTFEKVEPQEAVSENKIYDAIYGQHLFKDRTFELVKTTDGSSAPETYVLGAGDQLRITIFGISQADILLTINESGFVAPSGMAQIYLKGITLKDARKIVRNRFSTTYRFQSDEFAVTLQQARMLNVNVFGETKTGGSFQLSALNSALNAIVAAGGPTELGSLRSIELIRGEIRKKIDIYSFLTNPSMRFQYDLQHNDILFIPIAQKIVRIEGAIKRPMRYELMGKEGLKEALAFAGGVNYNTSVELVQIERNNGEKVALLEYKLADVLSGVLKVELLDGDLIRLKTVNKPLDRFVEINGAIFYPGKYEWKENMLLNQLIDKAQLTPQAFDGIYVIDRTLIDESNQVIKLSKSEAATFILEKKDKVTIYDRALYTDQLEIEVSGAVRLPFKKILPLGNQLTLKDAFEMAGGLKVTASEIAYIFRKNLLLQGKTEYIPVNPNNPGTVILKPGDQIMVYDKSIFLDKSSISLEGSVNNPISIPFSDNLTLRDLFLMAGGKKQSADLNRVDVFRLKYDQKSGSGFEKISVQVDTLYNVINTNLTFGLMPYDHIVIRDLTLYAKDNSVQVNGEVRFPGNYQMPSTVYRLSDLIKNAGGLNVLANHDYGKLYRSENQMGPIGINLKKALRRKKSSKFNPILLKGDLVTIYKNENTFSIRMVGTNYPDLKNDAKEIKHFVYQGKRSAKWYIKNFAGGFNEKANKNSLTVSYQNGQVESTSHFLGIFRNYPSLKNGGTINIELNPEKLKGEKKEVDFDAVFTRSFQALSSLLTITLLINQIGK